MMSGHQKMFAENDNKSYAVFIAIEQEQLKRKYFGDISGMRATISRHLDLRQQKFEDIAGKSSNIVHLLGSRGSRFH